MALSIVTSNFYNGNRNKRLLQRDPGNANSFFSWHRHSSDPKVTRIWHDNVQYFAALQSTAALLRGPSVFTRWQIFFHSSAVGHSIEVLVDVANSTVTGSFISRSLYDIRY